MYQELQKKIKSSNEQIKHSKVNKIFTDISEGYDFMNDLMSFGLHRIWKEEFIELIHLNEKFLVLDLASGSGDLIKIIKKKCSCTCFGFDSNMKMIEEARKKINEDKVYFFNGRAEFLPFRNKTFDAITVSFGLRNFSNINQSLKEIKRVIKNKGKFYCLEFSEVNNKIFRNFFHLYSRLIPYYGKFFLNNKNAYSYLIESIEEFPNQIQLTKKLLNSGFKNIEVIDVLDGIASIHIAEP